MPDPLDDSRPNIHHRSLGEKLLRVVSMASRLVPEEFSFFFDLFFSYRSPPSVCYCDSSPFSWPSFLCWSQPLSDSSRNLLRFCISPVVLSIGFSKKGRQIHPSYKFYHPAVSARLLGFSQAVPRLILAEDMKSRDRIKSARQAKESLARADQLLLSDLPSFWLSDDTSADYDTWWSAVCEYVFPDVFNLDTALSSFGIILPENSGVGRLSSDTSASTLSASSDSDRSSSQVAVREITDKSFS